MNGSILASVFEENVYSQRQLHVYFLRSYFGQTFRQRETCSERLWVGTH
jgi:hypothetical protein